MPVELIINHCAPTLAGLKTGNLFSFKFETDEEMDSKHAAYRM